MPEDPRRRRQQCAVANLLKIARQQRAAAAQLETQLVLDASHHCEAATVHSHAAMAYEAVAHTDPRLRRWSTDAALAACAAASRHELVAHLQESYAATPSTAQICTIRTIADTRGRPGAEYHYPAGQQSSGMPWNFMQIELRPNDRLVMPTIGPGELSHGHAHAEVQSLLDTAHAADRQFALAAAHWRQGVPGDTVYCGTYIWAIYEYNAGDARAAAQTWLGGFVETMRSAGLRDIQCAQPHSSTANVSDR